MEININNLHIHGYIGDTDVEKEIGQNLDVNVRYHLRDDIGSIDDDIKKTVDYVEVISLISDYISNSKCNLIETAAYDLATDILVKNDLIKDITVTLHKPNAPIDFSFDDIYVSHTIGWEKAYLSLGSNIGDKKKYISDAVSLLKASKGVKNLKLSDMYDTKPYGKIDQDDFVNCACELETYLTPYELLDLINTIENRLGRVRDKRWGPRTIDIDIVLFSDKVISEESLCIPHIDMANREFVLRPLSEIAPYAYHPVINMRVIDMLNAL